MKPIAGPNTMPFGLGGFCVTGAKINGVKFKSLNIHQQRSSTLFDLIDGNGNIHQYIQLVHIGSDYQNLDPTETTDILLDKIQDNCFFIKTQDPNTLVPIFVYQYQSNLIKLSNGTMSFKPWGYINYCNAIDEHAGLGVDPELSTLTASPANVTVGGNEYSTLTLTLRDSHGNLITSISSGVVFHVAGFSASDKYSIQNIDYSQATSGVITARLMGYESAIAVVSASVGAVNIDQTATVTFTGLHPLEDKFDPTQTTFVVPSPMYIDNTYNIVITLRDAEGALVKEALTTNLHVESSDGNVIIGAPDYSTALVDGTIKIPVQSGIVQTVYFIINVDGKVLTQYGVMNFIESNLIPNYKVTISPTVTSVYPGEQHTFDAIYTGTGIDSISKAGTWTTDAPAGDVTIHSDSTNTLEITFNTVGTYTITYTSSYDTSIIATSTVSVLGVGQYSKVFGYMSYVDNKISTYVSGKTSLAGPTVNPDTTMCISLKYFPENYVPTSYGTFTYSKRSATSPSEIVVTYSPFTITSVSPDFTKIYIKFNKGSVGNYTIKLTVPHSETNETTTLEFKVLLTNNNGTNPPLQTIGTNYRSVPLGNAMKLQRSFPLSMVFQYHYTTQIYADYDNLKPIPYESDFTYSTEPLDPNGRACHISPDNVFTSSGSEGMHRLTATCTDPTYTTSIDIKISDDLPSLWLQITPKDMLIHNVNEVVKIESNVIPAKYNSKNYIALSGSPYDTQRIIDTVNNTAEFLPGYQVGSQVWVSVSTETVFPLNPVGNTSKSIGNPTAAAQDFNYIGYTTLGNGQGVESMSVGGLYQLHASRAPAYGTVSQENIIVSFSDPSFFNKVTPLYYNTDSNSVCNNVYYRALKSGLVTATIFLPESNKTVIMDIFVFPSV